MNKERQIYIGLCLLLFFYFGYRAIEVPLVHDEASTYTFYIVPGEFMPGEAHWDANNHILNSALSALSYRLFGNSLLSILPLLFWAVFALSRRFEYSYVRWGFILSILLGSYFMEFFALSRGYGMSMAALLAAFECLLRYRDSGRFNALLGMMVAMTLAILSNLTLIVPGAILFAYLLFFFFIRKDRRASLLVPVVYFLALFGWAANLSLEFKARGLLYYGSEGNYMQTTLRSVFVNVFEPTSIGHYIAVLVFLLTAVLICIGEWQRERSLFQRLSDHWAFVMVVILVIGHLALHGLLDVNYPEDRTAIYLVPLLFLALFFALDVVPNRTLSRSIAAAFILFFSLDFVLTANATHVHHWTIEHIPDEITDRMASDGQESRTVSTYFTHVESFEVKQRINAQHVGVGSTIGFPDFSADYLLARTVSTLTLPDTHEELYRSEDSDIALWKRKQAVKRQTLQEGQRSFEAAKAKEYYPVIDESIDFTKGQKIITDVAIIVDSIGSFSPLQLVITVGSKEEGTRVYSFHKLHRFIADGKLDLKESVIVTDTIGGPGVLKAYLWNVEKQAIGQVDFKARASLVPADAY